MIRFLFTSTAFAKDNNLEQNTITITPSVANSIRIPANDKNTLYFIQDNTLLAIDSSDIKVINSLKSNSALANNDVNVPERTKIALLNTKIYEKTISNAEKEKLLTNDSSVITPYLTDIKQGQNAAGNIQTTLCVNYTLPLGHLHLDSATGAWTRIGAVEGDLTMSCRIYPGRQGRSVDFRLLP